MIHSCKCTASVLRGRIVAGNQELCGNTLPCLDHNRDQFKNLENGQHFVLITEAHRYMERQFHKVGVGAGKNRVGTWSIEPHYEVELVYPSCDVTIHLSSLEHQTLEEWCKKKDMTKTGLIKQALRTYVLCQTPEFQQLITNITQGLR